LLVTEGFSSVEEVAYVPVEDVAEIEGFDEELAGQLQLRARTFLEAETVRLTEQRRELGVSDELAGLPGLTNQMLVKLGESEVKTLEDFADLASDELTDAQEGILASFEIRESEANELIMKARVAAGWFTEEELLAAEEEKREAAELAAAQAEGAAEEAARSGA
jgi:N utilization substance protein A